MSGSGSGGREWSGSGSGSGSGGTPGAEKRGQPKARPELRPTSPAPVRVVASDAADPQTMTELLIRDLQLIGSGSFGHVASALLSTPGSPRPPTKVAIKKVLQDKKIKNRELELLLQMSHPNVVTLLHFFYSADAEKRGSGATEKEKGEVYLHLVMEFVPETLYRLCRNALKKRQLLDMRLTKLFVYQLFRGLGYMHAMGICHRDVKPQNLLVDAESGVLKICDLGSAKLIQAGQPSVAYICSRYYRAPELILGAEHYSLAVDVWAAGCVLGELLLGQPLFPGQSSPDQLVEIIRVLGTPSAQDMAAMKPQQREGLSALGNVGPLGWDRVFRPGTPGKAVALVRDVLRYQPGQRPSALQALAQPFFDDLRRSGPSSLSPRPPNLFDFSSTETKGLPSSLLDKLRPLSSPVPTSN